MRTEHWKKCVRTLTGMCQDEVVAPNITQKTFISNLRLFADSLEKDMKKNKEKGDES